jgi:uncharacterized protein with NRDE domain
MCIILFSYKSNPEYPLILASNRDEFYERPAAPAAFWDDSPELLAGRDLKQCGTWLGITKSGRVASLTNFRAPYSVMEDAPTRGELVTGFLKGREAPTSYIESICRNAPHYNGFNLLFGYVDDLYYFSNKGNIFEQVTPGLHGLSNQHLDTPWPKVEEGKKKLRSLLSAGNSFSPEAIFEILADTTRPADEELPDTGVGIEWERILSSVFVESPVYGTRFSTVLLVDNDGKVTFVERVLNHDPDHFETRAFEFTIHP